MRWSKGLDMKWSLYMSSNQQNLTIGSIGLKSDYRVVKISLTTGLGSDPAPRPHHHRSLCPNTTGNNARRASERVLFPSEWTGGRERESTVQSLSNRNDKILLLPPPPTPISSSKLLSDFDFCVSVISYLASIKTSLIITIVRSPKKLVLTR